MSFPAEAFIGVRAHEAPEGSLVLLRGDWALRCAFETNTGKKQQVLWLSGQNVGQISAVPNELALATEPSTKVSIRLLDVSQAKVNYDAVAGTAVVSATGQVELWGRIMGAGPDSIYGFDLSGKNIVPEDRIGHVLFDIYEVWIEKTIGATTLERLLFTVKSA